MMPSSTPIALLRMKAEPSLPSSERDRLVLQQLGAVIGVVLVDVGREVDLAERVADRLAHLAHDDLGEVLTALAVQIGDLRDERGALLDRGRPRPAAVGVERTLDPAGDVGVGRGRVRPQRLAGGGVDHCVLAHEAPH